jgi:hypothetical protein
MTITAHHILHPGCRAMGVGDNIYTAARATLQSASRINGLTTEQLDTLQVGLPLLVVAPLLGNDVAGYDQWHFEINKLS